MEKSDFSVHHQRSCWEESALDAVITPVGGGLNAGVATFFADKPTTRVFGAQPSFEGADDCLRGLQAGEQGPAVTTLTIADGLRTPVGFLNWEVISDPNNVAGVFAVTEEQIKAAMRLVLERMKVVVEKEAGEEGWDVGIVFSGGNTTVEAIGKLYSS